MEVNYKDMQGVTVELSKEQFYLPFVLSAFSAFPPSHTF